MPSPPHQDNFYWCLKKPTGLNFWIAIDNASKKNGGVYYYLGSQKLGLRKHINSGIAGSSQMIKNLPPKKYKKFYPNLKIGDLMFHHLQVIHGSGANSTNTSRKGLVVNVIAKDSKIDKIKRNAYLKNLNLQIKQRGKEHARI